MPDPSPVRRRWLRLSVRGSIVLVLVVGGGLGWIAYEIRTQRGAVAAAKRAGGYIRYSWESLAGKQTTARPPESIAPRWARRMVGDEPFQSVDDAEIVLFDPASATTLAAAARFDRLDSLSIEDFAGDAVRYDDLARLTQLQTLSLTGAGPNDAKLAAIGRLVSLRRLHIVQTEATDAGLAHLANLRDLELLTLYGAPNATDSGLAHALAGMPRLRNLDLSLVRLLPLSGDRPARKAWKTGQSRVFKHPRIHWGLQKPELPPREAWKTR
jgi:hypothetical protein